MRLNQSVVVQSWSRLIPCKATGQRCQDLWLFFQTQRVGSRQFQRPMRLSPVMCFDCKELLVRRQCCQGPAWRLRFPLILMAEDNLDRFRPPVGMCCKALISGQRDTRSIEQTLKRIFLARQNCYNSVEVRSVRKLRDRQPRASGFGFCWLCCRCWLPNGGCGADLYSASRQLSILQTRRVDRSISQTPSSVGFVKRPASLEPSHF